METPRADLEGIRMTEMKVAARQESPMVNSIRTLRALSSAEEGKESPNNTKFRRLPSIDRRSLAVHGRSCLFSQKKRRFFCPI